MHAEMKVGTEGHERESGKRDCMWSTEWRSGKIARFGRLLTKQRVSRVKTCDEVNKGLVSHAATVRRC